MKKPILATLGIAGACAACCAIPIAVPLLSGFSVAGLAAFDGSTGSAIGLGLIAALVIAGALMASKRRRAAAPACGMAGAGGAACGCGPNK